MSEHKAVHLIPAEAGRWTVTHVFPKEDLDLTDYHWWPVICWHVILEEESAFVRPLLAGDNCPDGRDAHVILTDGWVYYVNYDHPFSEFSKAHEYIMKTNGG